MTNRELPKLLCALVPLASLAGCSGSGEIVVVAPPTNFVIDEQEPNDTQFSPTPLGLLAIGAHVEAYGAICGAVCDPADGYSFSTSGPCALEFSLVAQNDAADFDLCAFDPSVGAYFVCYESGGPVESGSILLGAAAADLHLVVVPYIGAGTYTLYVDVLPLNAALAQVETVTPRALSALDYARIEAAHAVSNTIDVQFDADGRVRAWRERRAEGDTDLDTRTATREERRANRTVVE